MIAAQNSSDTAVIRRVRPEEWGDISKICCLTGNNGAPVPENRNWIFGEIWVGPYQYFLPHWSYVGLSVDGKVIGYLTGSPETLKFKRTVKWFYTFLFFGIMLKKIFFNFFKLKFLDFQGVKKFYRRELKIEKGPEDLFSSETWTKIYAEFPAHLHTNLLKEARGLGLGKKLIIAFENDLKKSKVSGIHLFCGPDPVPFYQKCGFNVLEKILFQSQVTGSASFEVYCMVKNLD